MSDAILTSVLVYFVQRDTFQSVFEWYFYIMLVYWRLAILLVYTEIWVVDIHWIIFRSQCSVVDRISCTLTHKISLCARAPFLYQGERTKFDRFVDPNVRGAKRRVCSDLRIYVIEFFLRLKIHKICADVSRFDIKKTQFQCQYG